jgi:hypothetical protein
MSYALPDRVRQSYSGGASVFPRRDLGHGSEPKTKLMYYPGRCT